LRASEITIPPIETQKSFSVIVETIEKTKDFQKLSSIEISNLFDTLIQKAFTGELVS
jgi:type I restriction enzyme S subunit